MASTSDGIVVAWLEGAAKRHGGWTAPEGEARATAIAELRALGGDDAALYAQAAGIMLGCHPDGDPQHVRYRIAAHLLLDAAGLTEADERVREWIAVGQERRDRTRAAHAAGDTYQRSFGQRDD